MSIEANEVTATKVFEVTVKQERVVTVETTATVFAIDEIDAGVQGEEKHERAWLDVRNVWGVTDVGLELPDIIPGSIEINGELVPMNDLKAANQFRLEWVALNAAREACATVKAAIDRGLVVNKDTMNGLLYSRLEHALSAEFPVGPTLEK